VLRVRWYLTFKLSSRDLVQMMAERDHPQMPQQCDRARSPAHKATVQPQSTNRKSNQRSGNLGRRPGRLAFVKVCWPDTNIYLITFAPEPRQPSFSLGADFTSGARLPIDRIVREPGGIIIAVRLQVKGSSFRDLPVTEELSDSLEERFAFLESVKGVRLRAGRVDFAGSPLIFPGRDGAPFSKGWRES
jgi:hypothetical protein